MRNSGVKWLVVFSAAALFWSMAAGMGRCDEGFTYGLFGQVSLYGNTKDPLHVVLFVSGDGGWNRGVVDMAKALASDDTLVMGIDIVHYLRAISASKAACIYPAGDLEMLSQFAQRKLGLPVYRHPILVGYSSGATLVYAALVESPKTFSGAISLGFGPDLLLKKPPCGGNALKYKRGRKNRGVIFFPVKHIGAPWIVLQGEIDQVCSAASAEAFVKKVDDGKLVRLPKVGHGFSVFRHWMPQFKAAFRRIAARQPATAASPHTRLSDLPLVELPVPSARGDLMAIIVSGDGGWASIDSDMGNLLSVRGIPVVGLDSLKYFWTPRTPDGAASDLERIIRYYGDTWKKREFLLIGYSRGADVLPFMVDRLPPEMRARIKLLVLLGLSKKISFEFHLSDWISGMSHASDLPILPEIKKLKGMRILCFCGKSEKDSQCRKLNPGLAETISMKGGHHFDGNYTAIVDQVLARLK